MSQLERQISELRSMITPFVAAELDSEKVVDWREACTITGRSKHGLADARRAGRILININSEDELVLVGYSSEYLVQSNYLSYLVHFHPRPQLEYLYNNPNPFHIDWLYYQFLLYMKKNISKKKKTNFW